MFLVIRVKLHWVLVTERGFPAITRSARLDARGGGFGGDEWSRWKHLLGRSGHNSVLFCWLSKDKISRMRSDTQLMMESFVFDAVL